MQAIVQTGPEEVEVKEQEPPTPASNEALVRIHTAGLCGSDAHAFKYEGGYEWIPIPRVMGHEYSGEVVEVGEDVRDFEVGQKVVEEPIHDCGRCFQCKNNQENVCQDFSITGMHTDGAYCNYTTVAEEHLHAIPDSVSLQDAAITEPTSIATRAVFTQSELQPGDKVLVEGPGPIGLLTAIIADSLGANVAVSGLQKDSQYRLPLLEQQNVTTVNVEETDLDEFAADFTDDIGFDTVFDTTGHRSGIETAIPQVRKGGEVVVVGLPSEPSEVFMTPVVRGEVDLNTSYGSTWRDFERALRLMENGTIDAGELVDTSFSKDAPGEAFRAFLNSETCKPVFTFAD